MTYVIDVVLECRQELVGDGYRPLTDEEAGILENMALYPILGRTVEHRDFDKMEVDDLDSGSGGELRDYFMIGATAYLEADSFNFSLGVSDDAPYEMAFKAIDEEVERRSKS